MKLTLLCLMLFGLVACSKDKPAETMPTDDNVESQDTMIHKEDAEPSAPTEPLEAKGESGDVATNELKLEGTLKYEEAPRVKSVKAFVHQEFVLTTADGTTHNLKSSESVSYDQLQAQDGKSIKITCTPKAAPAPNPMESAPSGVERPSRCEVTSLEAQ